MGVSCHRDLRKIGNLINVVKLDHFFIRKISDHYNLGVLKLVDILRQHFGFVLAMLAFRTENNKDGIFFFVKVTSCECSAVGRFINSKLGNSWKS